VLYRMAATIQIVVVLSVLIYGYNVVMTPLYVILLALLNDISMIPIAQDNAAPSSGPEIPSMPQILLASVIYGALLTAQSIGFFEYGLHSSWLDGEEPCTPSNCEYLSTCAYLQISIAIEFVILSCRAPGFVLSPKYLLDPAVRPSVALLAGVMFANVLVSVLAGAGAVIYQVKWADIGFIWIYDIVGILIIDIIKVALRFWQLPWMSAGAAYGVLEYAEMPAETGERGSQLRSALRSSVGRSSVRSVMRSNQASMAASGMMGSSIGGQRSQCEPKAASMLPFPYNLRANASRNFRSF